MQPAASRGGGTRPRHTRAADFVIVIVIASGKEESERSAQRETRNTQRSIPEEADLGVERSFATGCNCIQKKGFQISGATGAMPPDEAWHETDGRSACTSRCTSTAGGANPILVHLLVHTNLFGFSTVSQRSPARGPRRVRGSENETEGESHSGRHGLPAEGPAQAGGRPSRLEVSRAFGGLRLGFSSVPLGIGMLEGWNNGNGAGILILTSDELGCARDRKNGICLCKCFIFNTPTFQHSIVPIPMGCQ
jgi:hypothetical protein